MLGLEDSQPPGLEVDFRERGVLFHAIVAELFRRHPVLPADLDAARALAREQAAEVRRQVATTIGAKDLAFLDVEWDQLERALDGVVVCEHDLQRKNAAAGITVQHLIETDLAATFGGWR